MGKKSGPNSQVSHLVQSHFIKDVSEISKETIKDWNLVEKIIADNNRRFTDQPLRLDIFSPDVVDLRLVDLPGLIHVSIFCILSLILHQNPTREQPKDVRDMIKKVARGYIQ